MIVTLKYTLTFLANIHFFPDFHHSYSRPNYTEFHEHDHSQWLTLIARYVKKHGVSTMDYLHLSIN